MIKKVIAFNGSPRIGWNTDKMIKECLKGAQSLGAEVKLYQVSELKHVKPCISCLSCKRADHKFDGNCVIKDDLTPILKELKSADAIVVGSPIYWGMVSASIHPILERMWFSNYVYNKDRSSVFGKKIKTGFIFTMNVNEEMCQKLYSSLFSRVNTTMSTIFGSCEILNAYNTTQVSDYSQYDMSFFNINQKFIDQRELFPQELKQAFELGKRLVS